MDQMDLMGTSEYLDFSFFTFYIHFFWGFLQEEVCDMINKRYGDFHPSLQGSEELMVQVDEVSKEMDALKNCIENEVRVTVFRS